MNKTHTVISSNKESTFETTKAVCTYAVSSYLVGVGDATTQFTDTNLGVDLDITTVGIGNGDICFTLINLYSIIRNITTIITDLHSGLFAVCC